MVQRHQAIVIDTDGEQTVDPAIQPPVVNSKEEFIEAVKQSGLVGSWWCRFPSTHQVEP